MQRDSKTAKSIESLAPSQPTTVLFALENEDFVTNDCISSNIILEPSIAGNILVPLRSVSESDKNRDEGKEKINKQVAEVDKGNFEYAGPTEKLPKGLKHIREESSKEETTKGKTDKA